MTYSRAVASFGIAMIMLVVALAPMGLPPSANVEAGHDGPATSHLIDGGWFISGRIVRNVIVGNAIPVCSDDLPESTKTAVERWNSFLGKQVFQLEADGTVFESTDPGCAAMAPDPSLGIGSVLIVQDIRGCRPRAATACIYPAKRRLPNEQWDTYIWQPVIYVADYPVETVLFDLREVLPDGHDRVTRSVTHELGHVFGLGDYHEHQCWSASTDPPNDYDYTTERTIMSVGQAADGTTQRCWSPRPRDKDKDDFQLSYVPSDPVALQDHSGPRGEHEAVIAWDAFGVHVERGFSIQRRTTAGTWILQSTHAALPLIRPPQPLAFPLQPARVRLTRQPLGLQRYRVVALTNAPLQDGDVAASREIRVIVKGPPPNAPTGLTATGVVRGINLSWDLATDDPPINGYQYRIDSGDWQDIPSSNASTISYQLRGMLVAGITYAVEIRAVRALVPSEASDRVTATPTAPSRPPIIQPQYVTIDLIDGVTRTVWPGATVSVASAVRGTPITFVWYWVAATDTWLTYSTDPDAPSIIQTLTELETGEIYDFRATAIHAWRVRVAGTSARAQGALPGTPSETGWTATVTCASGFGPIPLRAAPTEAEAIAAADWLIDHPDGCRGNGTYTISE